MADGESIERLVVEFDAKTDKVLAKLNGLVRAHYGAANDIKKAFSNLGIEKSLDRVFDESRLTLLRQGGLNLRLFGSALEPLGPLGIAAGAGLAAFGAGLALAAKTATWAVELQHASEKLGITSQALQEFDYIAASSGVPVDQFREALSSLNTIFGQAQAGLLRPQSLKAFQALGFTQDQLLKFKTVQDLIDALPARFAAAGSAAEQAGIAKKLGIEALIPLMHAGAGGLADLTAKVAGYGTVSDEGVAKAAAMNDKLQTAKLRAGEAAHELGASLIPELVMLNGVLADTIGWWAKFLAGPSNADKIGHELEVAGKAQMAAQAARHGSFVDAVAAGASPAALLFNGAQAREALGKQKDAEAAQALAEVTRLAKDGQVKAASPPPAAHLDVPPKPHKVHQAKKGPSDNYDALQKQALDAEDSSAKDLASAMAALAIEIQARADFEKAAVADELKKQNADLDEQEKKITADKGITAAKKQTLIGELETVRATDKQAAAAKTALIDRNAAEALAKERLDIAEAQMQGQIEALKAQEAIAVGSKKHLAIQLQIFGLEEQIARAKIEEVIASKESTAAQKKIAQLQLDALNASQGQRRQAVVNAGASPLDAYTKQLTDETSGGGLSDSFQKIEVNGLQNLNSGLTEAIVNAKNFGQAFGNVLRGLESDLINLAIEKYLTLPLAQALGLTSGAGGGGGLISALIGGGGGGNASLAAFSAVPFASGTDSAPGGLSLVGENGPELINLQKGAGVISNSALRNLGSITPGMASHTTVMSFDLRGAVMTSDLLDQMNTLARTAEHRATMNGAALGVSTARQLIPAEMSRRQSLQIR